MLRKHERPTRGLSLGISRVDHGEAPHPSGAGLAYWYQRARLFVTGSPAPPAMRIEKEQPSRTGKTGDWRRRTILRPQNGAVLANASSSPGQSTDRPGVDGQSHGGIDEVWMQSEPCWPETVLRYVGGRAAKRAPQIAILNMRSAGHLDPPLRLTQDRDTERAVGRYTP